MEVSNSAAPLAPSAKLLLNQNTNSIILWRKSKRYIFSLGIFSESLILFHWQKLASLRTEADAAVDRAELAEAKNKKYEQLLLEKDQEITSLAHKLSILDADLEKAEAKINESKAAQEEGEHSKSSNEALTRKVQLLEEELDAAEKNVKETMEKYILFTIYVYFDCPPHVGCLRDLG